MLFVALSVMFQKVVHYRNIVSANTMKNPAFAAKRNQKLPENADTKEGAIKHDITWKTKSGYEAGNEKALLDCLLQTQQMDIKKERTQVLEQFNKELSFDAIAQKIDKAVNAL